MHGCVDIYRFCLHLHLVLHISFPWTVFRMQLLHSEKQSRDIWKIILKKKVHNTKTQYMSKHLITVITHWIFSYSYCHPRILDMGPLKTRSAYIHESMQSDQLWLSAGTKINKVHRLVCWNCMVTDIFSQSLVHIWFSLSLSVILCKW